MNVRETVSIIVRARRQGVELFAKADRKLGWKASPRPSGELLAALAEHKADILALLPPPQRAPGPSLAIGPAKAIAARLRAHGFRVYLDGDALGIADTTGRNRGFSWIAPPAEVFKTIVAGLADDPDLLDLKTTATAPAPESSEPDSGLDLYEPAAFEPEPTGLHEDLATLDPQPSERGEWK